MRVFVTANSATGKATILNAETGRPYVHKQAGVIPISAPPKRRKRRRKVTARRRRPSTKPVPVTKAARMPMPGLDEVPDPTDEIPPMTYRVVKRGHKPVKPNGARRLEMPKVPIE